jgi:hypothetical protein
MSIREQFHLLVPVCKRFFKVISNSQGVKNFEGLIENRSRYHSFLMYRDSLLEGKKNCLREVYFVADSIMYFYTNLHVAVIQIDGEHCAFVSVKNQKHSKMSSLAISRFFSDYFIGRSPEMDLLSSKVYQVIKFPTGDLSLQFVRMIHSPILAVHEETATIILAPENDNNNYSVIDLRDDRNSFLFSLRAPRGVTVHFVHRWLLRFDDSSSLHPLYYDLEKKLVLYTLSEINYNGVTFWIDYMYIQLTLKQTKTVIFRQHLNKFTIPKFRRITNSYFVLDGLDGYRTFYYNPKIPVACKAYDGKGETCEYFPMHLLLQSQARGNIQVFDCFMLKSRPAIKFNEDQESIWPSENTIALLQKINKQNSMTVTIDFISYSNK